ncbi:hypothetical protein [Salibacterium aidingense]|uniref:hypothetical protein n=1 Tax=Salibacterium aidingense TaxID=384933 RepID=UPI003BC7A5ED
MQRYAFFNSEDGDRVYSAEDWARIFSRIAKDGYVDGEEEELEVSATDPETLGVRVGLGAAWVQGRIYQIYDSAETLSLSDADLDNYRIDRIVVRLNYSERLIEVAVNEGTAAENPESPELTRNSSIYELSLARIIIPPGVTSISDGYITDERKDEKLCGESYSLVNRPLEEDLYNHLANNVIHEVDSDDTQLTYSGDNLTFVEDYKNGSLVKQTDLTYSSGDLTEVREQYFDSEGNMTNDYTLTLNYSNGELTSVTRSEN